MIAPATGPVVTEPSVQRPRHGRVDVPAATDEEKQLVKMTDELAAEHDQFVTRSIDIHGRSLRDWRTLGLRRFIGDHHDTLPDDGSQRVTLNRDQAAIISDAAAKTQTDPRIVLMAVETRDVAIYCVKFEAAEHIQRLITSGAMPDVGDFTPNELTGEDWMTERKAKFLMAQQIPVLTGGQDTGRTVPLLTKDDFHILNNAKLIEIAQSVFDEHWEAACGNDVLNMAALMVGVQGNQAGIPIWLHDEQRWLILLPDVSDVRIDTNCTLAKDAAYYQLDWVMPLDEAMQMPFMRKSHSATPYLEDPQTRLVFEQMLKDAAQTGPIGSTMEKMSGRSVTYAPKEGGTTAYLTASHYLNISGRYARSDFKREMVRFRVTWKRHHYPMSRQEALDGGYVRLMPYPLEEAVTHGIVEQSIEVDRSVSASGVMIEKMIPTLRLVEDGELTAPDQPNWPHRYVLLDDNSELTDIVVDPPDEEPPYAGASAEWPMVRHWQQIITLPHTHRLLLDCRCPYLVPPVGWAVNIPFPQSPFGIPLSARTESSQDFTNRLSEVILLTLCYGAYQQKVVPRSLWDWWEAEGIDPWQGPNQVSVIDDDVFKELFGSGVSRGFGVEPPKMDPMVVNLLTLWLQIHDEISGHVGVRQGRPPGSNMSGEALKELGQQAMGPVGYTAKSLEAMLERMATAMIHGMFTGGWLTLRTWKSRTTQYPVGVLKALRHRLKEIEFKVHAEIAVGRGLTRQQEHFEARENHSAGLIGRRETLERLDDPDAKFTTERRLEEAVTESRLPMLATSLPQLPASSIIKLAEEGVDPAMLQPQTPQNQPTAPQQATTPAPPQRAA